ncbi:Predicted arabinose efflux permease, MFS family [Jannaschia faecimaris]|uniref:Predicted arabinose efflux permease, MFS family n=1 Tax=Jannaschia faecimaris TaxID=1244108 RepID=A0A1H3NXQ0_9RHOB|nr:MFS transporter [Jannaschia faecimaris]SDY93325.1 Predicted arabinose efflux permease, MFS family [Jannaschia faecimaris]
MSTVTTIPDSNDSLAKRNVLVLVTAQALLGSQLPIAFTVAGLIGLTLAPTPLLATLPISLIVFGSMTTAPWISPLMQRRGRRFGFMLGAMAGAAGAALSMLALTTGQFWLFLVGAYFTGIFMSTLGFYRFAATDTASESFRPKAISYVMAGGLVSAFVARTVVTSTETATIIPFLATYGTVFVLNAVGMWLFLLLDIPKPEAPAAGASAGRTKMELLRTPTILVPIICAMVTYALMNLVMTSTPLAVVGCGFSVSDASNIVMFHVIAMYGPSFFTGHLITRYGTTRIIAAGLMLLAAAGLMALSGVELLNFYGALILLGVGWNFGFIGATSMLTAYHGAQERGTVQGLNDSMIFGMVTLASLSSGGLMGSAADAVSGWSAVNIAMVPFLVLAGGALIWLRNSHRRAG